MILFRRHPFIVVAGGSVAALAILVSLLHLESRSPTHATPPFRVYCAAALKPVMEAIAANYERDTGQPIVFDFGDSGSMLGSVTVRRDGDLFLPADDSYVRLAEREGLVAEIIPICRMRVVILTRSGNPLGITTFEDLLRSDVRLGIANPDRAALGTVVRAHLRGQGKWDAFDARADVRHPNVTAAANAVALGSRDATVVWDAVAVNYPELTVIRVPELNGATGRVELAVLTTSHNPDAARRFAQYVVDRDKGLSHFQRAGFTGLEP